MKKGILGLVLVLILGLSLYGCGGGGGGGNAGGGGTTVSGVASKGPIKSAIVKVYKIEKGEKGDLLGNATTDNTGHYSIDIGSYTGPVLVEVTGGSYKDEATGKDIDLTFSLRAAIGDARGDVKVAVTPLTELAVRKAEPGGLTSYKIDASNKLISQLLGEDITKTLPVDVTDKDACDNATDGQQEYGLLLAALSQMSKDTLKDIKDIINDIEDDLKDIKLEDTGTVLSNALKNFDKNKNNKTGMKPDKLVEHITTASTSGLTPTGSLKEAKERLADFLHNATEVNYNNFMDYMNSFVADSKEAHLFKALATLFDIYNSDAVSFIKDDVNGLGINFNTDFENLKEDVVYKFLHLTAKDIKGLLAEIETRLDQIDADLEQAEGVNTFISLTGFDTVYFDDVDVKLLRTIDKALKAICAYLQAVDFSVNWNVTITTTRGTKVEVDIRELIKNGDEITDEQLKEFLDNNKKLFTYSDPSKLAEFRTAFEEAKEQYSSAVKALEDLGESGRRLRYKNAFDLDTELDLWYAKAIEEHTLPSIQDAFGNPNATIIGVVVDDEENDEKYVDGKNGYYYLQETYNINLKYYKPVEGNITIYDLINGTKSPRDVLDAAIDALLSLLSNVIQQTDDLDAAIDAAIANENYEPYVPSGTTEVYKENVAETYWGGPIDTYTVPLADNITIDGNASEWGSIPTFYDNGDTKIKIARDSEGNLYLYVSKPEGFGNERYFFKMDMPGDLESFGIDLLFRDDELKAGYYDSIIWYEVDTVKPSQSGETVIGAEVKYPDGFNKLTKAGSINHFGWGPATGVDDWKQNWKQIKLLPETGE